MAAGSKNKRKGAKCDSREAGYKPDNSSEERDESLERPTAPSEVWRQQATEELPSEASEVIAKMTEAVVPPPPLLQPTLSKDGWDMSIEEVEVEICCGLIFAHHLIRQNWDLVLTMMANKTDVEKLKANWADFVSSFELEDPKELPNVDPSPLSYQREDLTSPTKESKVGWIYVPIYWPQSEILEAVNFTIELHDNELRETQYPGCYELTPLSYLEGFSAIEKIHVPKHFKIVDVELGRP